MCTLAAHAAQCMKYDFTLDAGLCKGMVVKGSRCQPDSDTMTAETDKTLMQAEGTQAMCLGVSATCLTLSTSTKDGVSLICFHREKRIVQR